MQKTERVLKADRHTTMMAWGIRPGTMPAHEWSVLVILASVHFVHIMDFMLMMPLGPQFMRLFGITPQQFGFLFSVYTFSAGLSGFLAAFVIDRFDRKTALIWLCAGFCIATLMCTLASTYTMLLIARGVVGAFGGVMGTVIFSIVGDVIPAQRRATATGTVMSSFSLVAVMGLPAGVWLADISDWRAPFVLVSVLGMLVVIVAWRLLPSVGSHLQYQREENHLRQLRLIFFNRNHLTAFLFIAVLMFAGFSIIPFISPYMVANAGLKETDLAYLYFWGGLFTFFTARMTGRYADQYGQRRVFSIAAALSIIPILLITNLTRVSLEIAIICMVLFMIFVSGRFVPAVALIIASVEPRLRGSFMSLNSSVQQISAGCASLMAGSVIGKSVTGELTHYNVIGLIAALATVACIAISARLRSAAEE